MPFISRLMILVSVATSFSVTASVITVVVSIGAALTLSGSAANAQRVKRLVVFFMALSGFYFALIFNALPER